MLSDSFRLVKQLIVALSIACLFSAGLTSVATASIGMSKGRLEQQYGPAAVVQEDSAHFRTDKEWRKQGAKQAKAYGYLTAVRKFFEWLEENIGLLLAKDKEALAFAIERSCLNKAQIVAEDETETGIRATLNLGHTFGHAIETGAGYGIFLHGEAVSIGTCQAADLSRRKGWLTDADVERIIALYKKANLPVNPPKQLDSDRFLELMAVDKKNIDGKIRLILLTKIGVATLPIGIDSSLLEQTLNSYGR